MIQTPDALVYAEHFTKTLPHGVLLTSQAEKFDAMVIGWGAIGIVWGKPALTVYVREGRFTREQIDESGAFTVCMPLKAPIPSINRICGSLSGRNLDKADAAQLTLVDARVNGVPAVREYPVTMECKVLYRQVQALSLIPEPIRSVCYPQDVPGDYPMANRDPHVMYIGQIVSAYTIE